MSTHRARAARKRGRPYTCGNERLGAPMTICLPPVMQAAVLAEMALSGKRRAAELRSLILDGLALRAERRALMAKPVKPALATEPWTQPHYASTAASPAAKRGA